MIASLQGRVAHQGEDHAVLDVQGVGYLVHASARSLRQLTAGEVARVLVDLQITDEAIRLYGFVDEAERTCFRLLQTVQGVGARVALSLLGVLGPDGLSVAVAVGDRAALSRAPGVGPRLAARIATELKDRLGEVQTSPTVAGMAAATLDPVDQDAILALARLGFGRSEAHAALARVRQRVGSDATLDLLIRQCLGELSRPETAA